MQRSVEDGVIITCDFCGTDWDQLMPMIEGHHGSVMCLDCCKVAIEEVKVKEGKFRCTLCLREGIPAEEARWAGQFVREQFEETVGVVCEDCVKQAARGFSSDKDVDWKWVRKPL